MAKRVKKWIGPALAKHKPGSMHRKFGIKKGIKIPVSLLRKASKCRVNMSFRNPTKKGKRVIRCTRLLKKASQMFLNIRKGGKRKGAKRRKTKKRARR